MNISMPFALQMITLLIVVALAAWWLMRNRLSQHKRGERPGGIAGPSRDNPIEDKLR